MNQISATSAAAMDNIDELVYILPYRIFRKLENMTAASAIMSGEVSGDSLKTALIEKYGINIDSDPALSLPFYNILHVFSLLSSLMDSPESSRRTNPPPSLIKSGGKGREEEEEEVWTEHTPNINDGFRWKKYGQKIIQKSPYQRSYLKCSYAEEQDCKAKRKVQQIGESRPTLFEIIYSSRHTCHADTDTHGVGSSSMIEFYPHELPSVTDLDLPPLVTVDHQEPIIQDPVINDMKTEDDGDEQVLSPFLDVANFFADDFDFTF